MNLNGVGRVIESRRHGEALDMLDAMILLGVLVKDAANAVARRISDWSILMVVYGADGAKEKFGTEKDPMVFREIWRAREADLGIVEDAFRAMNPELLKPLSEPVPEKFQPVLLRVREAKSKTDAEALRKADALIMGIKNAFPDLDLPDAPHDCASCSDDIRKICPLPAAEKWRSEHKG